MAFIPPPSPGGHEYEYGRRRKLEREQARRGEAPQDNREGLLRQRLLRSAAAVLVLVTLAVIALAALVIFGD